ncbi:hypothetical protein IJU97_05470 [bacterium]|nr:hypothetical protein [bacterium]
MITEKKITVKIENVHLAVKRQKQNVEIIKKKVKKNVMKEMLTELNEVLVVANVEISSFLFAEMVLNLKEKAAT